MPLNRRALLTAALGAGTALILPPTLADNAEAARRYWALDQTMVPGSWLDIPRGTGLWRTAGNRWVVRVNWPDGVWEQHLVVPERTGQTRLRLGRSDRIGGAVVYDPDDANRLLVIYGRVPFSEL